MSAERVDKKTVIAALEEIATLLELSGANPFKSRAYENGARALRGYDQGLEAGLESGEIAELKGVGKSLLAEIEALVETGESPALEELREKIPAGLLDIVRVPGLGPKRARALYEKLDISSLGELEYACNENRLVQLEGFGEKTQAKILKGIDYLNRFSGRHLLADGWLASERLMEALGKIDGIRQMEVAGSIRRRKETIKDVDILVASDAPEKVHEALTKMDLVEDVIGSGDTKSSVRLVTGLQVDLRTVSETQFPFALHYFTGSKEHNTRMRQRAKERGLKLNEYGLFPSDDGDDSLACDDEAAIFERLELPEIAPELREDFGEFEAGEEGELPELVRREDIRGVLHNHSTWSDGANSIEEMALAAKALDLEYFGLSDHSQTAVYAHGLTADDVRAQHEEIDELNEKLEGITILKGIESDILPDGSLDYEDDVLELFDFVVASVHANFGLSREKQTQRCVRAVQNPYTSVLGHPTGRLLLTREGFDIDMADVIEAAAEAGCAIELNANPHRLDLDWRDLRNAASRGAKISIGPDAHRTKGLEDLRYGVAIARKGWLRASDVLNTMGLEELREYWREG